MSSLCIEVVCVLILAFNVPHNLYITGHALFTKIATHIILFKQILIQIASSKLSAPHPLQSIPYANLYSNLLKILTIYGLDPLLLPRMCTICL